MRRLLFWIALLVLIAVNPLPLAAETPTLHTVAWGETLYSIARAFGVTPQLLASTNGISVNSWVYAGQQLAIPAARSASTPAVTPSGYYTVRAGDTLFSIATRYGTTVQAIAALNNLPASGLIYVGWSLKIPSAASASPQPPSAQTHIVQPGEYLSMLAFKYGTTVQAIMLANNLPNAWLVHAGQRLIIPGGSGQPTAPSPTAATTDIRVSGVPLYRQQQTLTCEEASVAMASRGTIGEARLVAAMPRSDNPFLGIRGKTNSPYYGGLTDYGAYAQAIQKGLTALGVKSEVMHGQPYEDFKGAVLAHLRAGRPVVWWHTWHDTYQIPVSVKTSSGTWVKLVPYEHAGVIVAATDRGVTYHDPYDATVRAISWVEFKRVSAYFDNMALVLR